MKNLHVIATDKASRLYLVKDKLKLSPLKFTNDKEVGWLTQHIYITNSEEIKEGDWCINLNSPYQHKELCRIDNQIELERYAQKTGNACRKIILTTDLDLIKDGVQSIDDGFLEWFVKNPSCERVDVKHKDVVQYGNMTMYDHNGDGSHYFCKDCEVETSRSKEELLKFGVEYYKIIIPKDEPKQETLEEAVKKYLNNGEPQNTYSSFIEGAKWQQERMYSEEEVEFIIKIFNCYWFENNPEHEDNLKDWELSKKLSKKLFEQFKKK